MLRIGVLGAGHLGKIHIKCIEQVEDFELAGFFDPDEANAKKVENELNIKKYDSIGFNSRTIKYITTKTKELLSNRKKRITKAYS